MSLLNNPAPDFQLMDSENKMVSLKDFLGRKVLIVFYPGDDTPVCTKQLCSYNSGLDEFKELGVEILGINTNSVESHKNFKAKYKLGFTLLSDEDGKVCESYGTKGLLGGIKRSTFLINEKSEIIFENEVFPMFYKDKEEIIREIKKLL